MAISVATVSAQSAGGKVEFEIASVNVSAPPKTGPVFHGCRGGPGSNDPTLWTCQNMSLAAFIAQSYEIEEDQLIAPDWARSAMFDVTARVALGTSAPAFVAMQQNLLADRFHLLIHHENKSVKVYDLVVAKGGPKLQGVKGDVSYVPAGPAGPSRRAVDAEGFPLADTPGFVSLAGYAKYYNPSITMPGLAQALKKYLGAPVRDATLLTGRYEVRLRWIVELSRPGGSAVLESAPNLLEALQEQLGLRAEPKSGVVELLVVDQADKTPIEN